MSRIMIFKRSMFSLQMLLVGFNVVFLCSTSTMVDAENRQFSKLRKQFEDRKLQLISGCGILQRRLGNRFRSSLFQSNANTPVFAARGGCTCEGQDLQTAEFECNTGTFCSPDGTVCGGVTIGGGVNVAEGGLSTTKLCITDFTSPLVPFPLSKICIDYEVNSPSEVITRKFCPRGLSKCLSRNRVKVKKNGHEKQKLGFTEISDESIMIFESCTISALGFPCASCSVCDGQGGIAFDCSNLLDGLKYDFCAPFRPLTSLYQDFEATLPNLNKEKQHHHHDDY